MCRSTTRPKDKPDASLTSIKKAAVYEIWDRVTKKAIWICKSYPNAPLDVRDDPLKLKDFFPCPKPLLGTVSPDSLVPTPTTSTTRTSADEIDNLTARIDVLIDALRVRGFYAGVEGHGPQHPALVQRQHPDPGRKAGRC
jgi:hypothetical protein